jgi:hypothetical protein
MDNIFRKRPGTTYVRLSMNSNSYAFLYCLKFPISYYDVCVNCTSETTTKQRKIQNTYQNYIKYKYVPFINGCGQLALDGVFEADVFWNSEVFKYKKDMVYRVIPPEDLEQHSIIKPIIEALAYIQKT